MFDKIEQIIEKMVREGYDSLTESEKFTFDKYQAALEADAGVCND